MAPTSDIPTSVPSNQRFCGRRVRGAFTIIEMLVVLVIIGILAGIVITLAQRVSHGGKFSATRNVLQIADGLLTEYVSRREAPPPMFVTTNRTQVNTAGMDNQLAPERYMFPILDGRYDGRSFGPVIGGGPTQRFDKDADPAQPSGALLLLALTSESPNVKRELEAVDARFVQQRDVFAYGWLVDAAGEPTGQPVLRRLRLPVLVDAFGNLVRYVHPGFQGGYGNFYNNDAVATSTTRNMLELGMSRQNGQPLIARFSRSYRPFNPANSPNTAVGDADEGLAIGGHGYFYSAGIDGDPGTRHDNVYTKEPTFPAETSKLN